MTMLHTLDALPLFNLKTTEKKTMNHHTPSSLTLPQIQMLERMLAAIENMGVSYAVFLPDGSEKKTGIYAAPTDEKKARAPLMYPRGTIQAHFEPYIKDMKTGDVVIVPLGSFGREKVRGGICSYCSRHWGLGTYTTAFHPDGVEILRTDGF